MLSIYFVVYTFMQTIFADTLRARQFGSDTLHCMVPGSTADESPGMAPEDEEGLTSADDLGIPSLRTNSDGLDEISLGHSMHDPPHTGITGVVRAGESLGTGI